MTIFAASKSRKQARSAAHRETFRPKRSILEALETGTPTASRHLDLRRLLPIPGSSSRSPFRVRRHQGGFTLIELLTVVAILGILATIAIGAYSRQVRSARRAEIIGDLSGITLRQKTFLGVNGHYASSTTAESTVYPALPFAVNGEQTWNPSDPGYTGPASGQYARGGEAVHGFDALRFMPEGGRSYCGYGTISGWGSDSPDEEFADEPPQTGIGGNLFPRGNDAAEALYARDWFYSFALCDFDRDGTYWALRTAHYASDILYTSFGDYAENE